MIVVEVAAPPMPFERHTGRVGRAVRRALALRCPRCGEGALFASWFTMRQVCDVCDFRFERAQGYFVGAIYVNYAATALIAIGGYLLLWAFTTLSTAWHLALVLPVVLLFPLWFFRYSRSLWLALEYLVNPEP